MSVTQNYTINTSSEVFQYIRTAVMGRLDDKARVASLTDRPLPDFLKNEFLRGVEAITALDCATVMTREDLHGALDARTMATVVRELRCMRDAITGCFVIPGMAHTTSERIARLVSIDAALFVLENQK